MSTITLQKLVISLRMGKCMTVKKKTRLTSYNFWVRIVSAVVLILRIILSKFGINIDSAFILDIATLVAGFLVVVGIINEPTGITISYKNELGDDMANTENIKTKIDEKLKEVEKIFASFGIKDKEVVAESLQKIDDFLVTILQNELKDIEKMQNELDDNVDEVENEEGVDTVEDTESVNETENAFGENEETEECGSVEAENGNTKAVEFEGLEVGSVDTQKEEMRNEVSESEEFKSETIENETEETEIVKAGGQMNIQPAELETIVVSTDNHQDVNLKVINQMVEECSQGANHQITVGHEVNPEATNLQIVNNYGCSPQDTANQGVGGQGANNQITTGQILSSQTTNSGDTKTAPLKQSAVELIKNLQDEFCGGDQNKRDEFCDRLLIVLENNLDSLVQQ